MSEKVVRVDLMELVIPNVLGTMKHYLYSALSDAGWKNGQEITRCYNGGRVVEYRFNIIENKG